MAQSLSPSIAYPQTTRGNVVDDYHGTTVADPYRWLEENESEATAQWVASQNEATRQFLDAVPERERFVKRLTELWNFERFSTPVRRGKYYFFSHNNGLQNQNILYKSTSLESPREVLLDPNTLSTDGTVALSSWEPTDDGRLIAYSLADGGSDWRTIKVRDVASGEDATDEIRWVKFSPIAWMPNASGFFIVGMTNRPLVKNCRASTTFKNFTSTNSDNRNPLTRWFTNVTMKRNGGFHPR